VLVVSSAAALRVDRAVAWLVAQPADREVVVVAASMEAAGRLCRQASDGARFGWHRFSLASLAARLGLAELAAAGRVAIGGLSREALCARLVRSRRGTLGPLDRIADAPGLARALASTLDELGMAGVTAAALAAQAPVIADLAAADARELAAAGLADRPSIFAAATIAAASHPLAGSPLLLLDVSLRSRLEADFVQALAARAPAVFATCPAGDEESLERLRAIVA
jgi:ATP-dependent helicase/nuclease subunit B